MNQPNPYEAPKVPLEARALAAGLGKCPACQGVDLHRPRFTWWGGAIGPKMLNHTVCRGCGLGFNAKTLRSNFKAIVWYQVITGLLAIGLIVLMRSMR